MTLDEMHRGRWVLRHLVRLLVVAPLLLGGPWLAVAVGAHTQLLYDFKGGLYDAGTAILHGLSPYQPHFLAHQAAIMRAGGIAIGETYRRPFSIPVYPAGANLAVVPLSLLPFWVAGTVYTVISLAAMPAGLRLLGVRDWRCHALVLISWPFLFGLLLGAIGPFLVLGCGIAWHFRERLWPGALAIAAIVAAKIFPWTLGVWLLVTRRYRAAAVCAAACALMTFGAWAAIGWHGLAQYPAMVSEMSFIQEGRSDSLVAALLALGAAPGVASALAIGAAVGLLAVAARVARRPGGDRRAFGLAVLAALLGTPIVWDHYMVLLFVPVALASPRLSRLWLAPGIAPVLIVLSKAVIPDSTRVQAYSPDVLRPALAYLALDALIAVCLCTTAEQRAALRARVRARAAGRRPRGNELAPAGSRA